MNTSLNREVPIIRAVPRALGALAIGAMVIGRLAIGHARIRRLETTSLSSGACGLLKTFRFRQRRVLSVRHVVPVMLNTPLHYKKAVCAER